MSIIKQNDNIIFIGGIQKSGKTLMRNILNKHPFVKIGYENAFYKLLFKKYSDGLKNKDISQFLDDLINTKSFNIWNKTIFSNSIEISISN